MFDVTIPSHIKLGIRDIEDTSLSGAIEASFISLDDYVIMVWNGIAIYLSCRYDISVIMRDLLSLASNLTNNVNEFEVHWTSTDFFAIWKIYTYGDDISVFSEWYVASNKTRFIQDELNKSNKLVISRKEFANKICTILRFVKNALEQVGHDKRSLSDYHEL